MVSDFCGEKTPILFVINKADIYTRAAALAKDIAWQTREEALAVSALTGEGISTAKEALTRLPQKSYGAQYITNSGE